MCEISDPAGRYAEHRTMKGEEVYFYQGIDFIRDVEVEAQKELAAYFGCSDVELRPISGQMANEVVFKGVVKFLNRGRAAGQLSRRMRLVLNNDLSKGGHLSAQPMGALFNWIEEDPATGKENVVNFPVRKDNPYKPDLERPGRPPRDAQARAHRLRQEHVPLPASRSGSWPTSSRTGRSGPILMFDMAHVLGLYGAFQEPFAEGADVVTGQHPQDLLRAPARRRRRQHRQGQPAAAALDRHQVPGLPRLDVQPSPGDPARPAHGGLRDERLQGAPSRTAVRANAKAFAKALAAHGIPVEGDPADGYTETHQVLVRVKAFGPGMEIARRLEDNNIVVNYQALPDDETFLDSSGIRLGVQEMTRFGMKEKDFDRLAGYMADCVIRNKPVKDEVAAFRKGFLEMGYCLPPAEAVPLAARILAAAVPEPELRGPLRREPPQARSLT